MTHAIDIHTYIELILYAIINITKMLRTLCVTSYDRVGVHDISLLHNKRVLMGVYIIIIFYFFLI